MTGIGNEINIKLTLKYDISIVGPDYPFRVKGLLEYVVTPKMKQ